MSVITGFKSTDIESRSKVQSSTVEYIGPKRQGLDVVSWQGAYLVQSGTTLSTSTESFIGITGISSVARAGDLLKIGSEYSSILSVAGDVAEVAHNFVGSVTSQAYELYRFTLLKTDSSGGLIPGVEYTAPAPQVSFLLVEENLTASAATSTTVTAPFTAGYTRVGDYISFAIFEQGVARAYRRIISLVAGVATVDVAFPATPNAADVFDVFRPHPAKLAPDGSTVIAAYNPSTLGYETIQLSADSRVLVSAAVSSLPNEGQQTMANSISVAIASNQSAVPVTASHDVTGLADGRKTVTTAGTAETIASSTVCKWVTIQALNSNTGVAVVGGSTVVAASGTRRGVALFPNDTITLQIDNLVDVYVDVTVSGEGVSYTYGT